MRRRLGLSAAQLGRLIGVSEQSIYNWETKKATPRKDAFAAIIELRSLGKRDAHRRLSEKAPKAATTTARKRNKTARNRAKRAKRK